jgi:hypothetical protein
MVMVVRRDVKHSSQDRYEDMKNDTIPQGNNVSDFVINCS